MRTTTNTLAVVSALCFIAYAQIDTAQAASFDCGKAGTKVEHMICDDPEISKLDDELSVAYKAALQDQSIAEAVRQMQKQWMKERNNCPDAGCVKAAYQKRIGQLLPPQSAPAQTAQSNQPTETACLAPKIDWRNYEWTIITGKGEAICKEMLAYLKSRPNDIAPPTCPDERLPKNGNWTRPEIRILDEAERQHILVGIPERFRQIPNGPVSYERKIRESKLLRVVKGDISGDGVPELFLAIRPGDDPKKTCKTVTECALSDDVFKKEIIISDGGCDYYELLPMIEDGTDINWSHRLMIHTPILWYGELVFYKNFPYWMSYVSWFQGAHDDFAHSRIRPNEPNSKIFGLYGIGHAVIGQYGGPLKPAPFSEVQNLRGDGAACDFGYFHRDNLKQHSTRKGE